MRPAKTSAHRVVLVYPVRLERTTSELKVQSSNQLSYRCKIRCETLSQNTTLRFGMYTTSFLLCDLRRGRSANLYRIRIALYQLSYQIVVGLLYYPGSTPNSIQFAGSCPASLRKIGSRTHYYKAYETCVIFISVSLFRNFGVIE